MRELTGAPRAEPGIAAVIFDWAGTIVDFGSLAPVVSIVQTFAARGVQVTTAEARGPMGLEKREHLRRLLADAGIAGRWSAANGAEPCPRDVDELYEELEPRLVQAVKRYSRLVPGVRELTDELRSWGIRIGTTTGYLRPLMDILAAEAARQGFQADAVVCPSDVPAGRPYPWMCFLNAIRLGVFPLVGMVKIGDTPADIHEGLNAGMWTIGVTLSGNEVGMSEVEVEQMTADERFERAQEAGRRLLEAGAHYVTESARTCRSILARIEERIIRGEHPAREKARERA
jgi:phosphonoacetaldehyde hydrolase